MSEPSCYNLGRFKIFADDLMVEDPNSPGEKISYWFSPLEWLETKEGQLLSKQGWRLPSKIELKVLGALIDFEVGNLNSSPTCGDENQDFLPGYWTGDLVGQTSIGDWYTVMQVHPGFTNWIPAPLSWDEARVGGIRNYRIRLVKKLQ